MNDHDDAAAVTAQRFYAVHGAEHLEHDAERLIERCAGHLAELFVLTNRVALGIAMRVRSEIESEGVEGFIDHERGTSRMVLVRDTARKTLHMVSAAELLQLVRTRGAYRDPPTSTR